MCKGLKNATSLMHTYLARMFCFDCCKCLCATIPPPGRPVSNSSSAPLVATTATTDDHLQCSSTFPAYWILGKVEIKFWISPSRIVDGHWKRSSVVAVATTRDAEEDVRHWSTGGGIVAHKHSQWPKQNIQARYVCMKDEAAFCTFSVQRSPPYKCLR